VRKTSFLIYAAVAIALVGVLSALAMVATIPLPEKVKSSDAVLIAEVEWLVTNSYFYVFNATNRPAGEFEVNGDDTFLLRSDVEDYLDLLRHLNRRRKRLQLPPTEDGCTPANPLDGEAFRFSPEVTAGCRVLGAFKGSQTNELVRVVFRDPGPARITPWPRVLKSGRRYILWLEETNGVFRMISRHQGCREVASNYVDRAALKDNNIHETYITHDEYIDRIRKEIEKQKAQQGNRP
jgi:hypothetical protein